MYSRSTHTFNVENAGIVRVTIQNIKKILIHGGMSGIMCDSTVFVFQDCEVFGSVLDIEGGPQKLPKTAKVLSQLKAMENSIRETLY